MPPKWHGCRRHEVQTASGSSNRPIPRSCRTRFAGSRLPRLRLAEARGMRHTTAGLDTFLLVRPVLSISPPSRRSISAGEPGSTRIAGSGGDLVPRETTCRQLKLHSPAKAVLSRSGRPRIPSSTSAAAAFRQPHPEASGWNSEQARIPEAAPICHRSGACSRHRSEACQRRWCRPSRRVWPMRATT
jgi:hypothetical protein